MSGRLIGKPDGADFKKAKDVSGIACNRALGFPRLCLIADDEAQGAQIVILRDGALLAGDYIRLVDANFGGKPLELDAEGVAFGGGLFCVTGSHGRPRHSDDPAKDARSNAKAEATRRIFRIALDESQVDMQTGKLKSSPKIEGWSLSALLLGDDALAPAFDKALEDGGTTIEGIAIRGGDLLVGLRSPVQAKRRRSSRCPLQASDKLARRL